MAVVKIIELVGVSGARARVGFQRVQPGMRRR